MPLIKKSDKKTPEKKPVKNKKNAATNAGGKVNLTAKIKEDTVAEKAYVKPENNPEIEKAGHARETMISFRRSLYSSKMIGTAQDLIPFAWRQPLKLADKKKMSRIFKELAAEQVEREMLMPVKQDE